MIRARLLALAIAVVVVHAAPARALVCSFSSVTGVAFGTYDVFSANSTTVAGNVRYECVSVLPGDTILIEISGGGAGSNRPRQLTGPSSTLAYDLYLDATRTIAWGDGSGGTSRYGPLEPPESTAVDVPVYGKIPANQNVAAGAYTDTVVVTLLF